MFDVQGREVTSKKRLVSDVQAMRWVGTLPEKFKPELRKTHEEAAHAVSSVVDSSTDFLDPADDMPASNGDIVEDDATQDLSDMTYKDNCRPSALQYEQELYQPYVVAVPSDVRAVQKLLSDPLSAIASTDKHGESLENLNKKLETDKSE